MICCQASYFQSVCYVRFSSGGWWGSSFCIFSNVGYRHDWVSVTNMSNVKMIGEVTIGPQIRRVNKGQKFCRDAKAD
jgi:hypothetical protein